jgi:hypothetical protein
MPVYAVDLKDTPTEREDDLIDRGVKQIAALVAAKVTGKGLFMNPGPTERSWIFGLLDATDEQESEFVTSLTPKIEGFLRAGFPEATVTIEAPEITLAIPKTS